MKKISIIILFILTNFIFYANNTKNETYPVRELKVINSNLFTTLDTIIQMKEEIDAYKGSKFFLLEFDEDSIKTDLLFIRAYEKIYYHYPDIIGYFDYRGHSFVIRGKGLDSTIFQKTNKMRDFDFGFPPTKYTKKGEPIIGTFAIFAVWSMRYKSGKFRILSFFTNNENDHWFNYIDEEYKEE